MTGPVTAWVEAYRRAWESNEPDDIRALFTETAEYRTEPWGEPWRGLDEIVKQWLANKDDPGQTTFEWESLVDSADLGVVQGTTAYRGASTYSNLWVIRFDEAGRASEFTEWWMDQSKAS
jgi:hypothetical protein